MAPTPTPARSGSVVSAAVGLTCDGVRGRDRAEEAAWPYGGSVLHGRDGERARLASMLQGAREGRATTVLVRGEPGMGKSALLEDTAARATDLRVLRTAGLEAQSTFAFAALHRL